MPRLLYAMLGELPIAVEDGKVHLGGSVGYCAQSAWIRNATLRDNATQPSNQYLHIYVYMHLRDRHLGLRVYIYIYIFISYYISSYL